MTWYWAALIGVAASLAPFVALGAVGAYVTRRHQQAIRDRQTARRLQRAADHLIVCLEDDRETHLKFRRIVDNEFPGWRTPRPYDHERGG